MANTATTTTSSPSPPPNVHTDVAVCLISDDEDDVNTESSEDDYYNKQNQLKKTELSSNLQKWTNYLSGWQDRYLVLKDGILSYYKGKQKKFFNSI
jgi:hypothetical protein